MKVIDENLNLLGNRLFNLKVKVFGRSDHFASRQNLDNDLRMKSAVKDKSSAKNKADKKNSKKQSAKPKTKKASEPIKKSSRSNKTGSKKTAATTHVAKEKSKPKKSEPKRVMKEKKSVAPSKKVDDSKTKSVKRTSKAEKMKKEEQPASKRRKARIYSGRSQLKDFLIGDTVIFRKFRDWNDITKLIEMRGKVIRKGRDSESELGFIEVEFEVQTPAGMTIQHRRFFVK